MERYTKTLTATAIKLVLFSIFAYPLLLTNLMGQGQRPPDCYRSFTFTAPAAGPFISNYGTGSPDGGQVCTIWLLGYAVSNVGGSVSSLSLVVQSAPAATPTTPGAWVTYAGTVSTGVNPNTSITGAQTLLSNGAIAIPFVRMNLTALSATGTTTVFGILQGWSEGNAGGGGSGGSACPGTTVTPCVIAGVDGTGTEHTVITDNEGRLVGGAYPSSTAIALTTSGLTQIIAASGSTVITLGSISVSFNSTTDFQLEYGTGSNCGTGTTALTGNYKSILAIALDNPIEVPSGKALCVNLGTSVTGGGLALYNQQ